MAVEETAAAGRRRIRPGGAGPRWAGAFGWADLLGPVGIASAVFVVCLWLRDQGLTSVTSDVQRAMGSLGLLTGLLASDLMVLQVIVLARIPWVERGWGHDLLARRHKTLGYWSFYLMIAHLLLFAAERVARDPSGALGALWRVFVTDSWMLFATVGTLLIIGVVVTSIRIARRRLRYESWHLLHLYSYLGMAFSFPHTLGDGADFHEPWARAYWWTLYLFAAGATVVYRLALPGRRSLYHRLRVAEVRTEGEGVVSVTLSGHRLDRLGARSGQFFVWRFLDGPGWSRGHPYALSAAPRRDRLRITVKAESADSARTAELRPGTRALIEGPYGGLTARRGGRRMLLIAAGIGITPLRALIEDAGYGPGEATLVYRFSRPEHAVFVGELREIAARRGVALHFLPGPRRAGDSWLPALPGPPGPYAGDVEVLRDLVPDLADRDVYLCGPPAWLHAVETAARRAGVRRDRVHTEEFSW